MQLQGSPAATHTQPAWHNTNPCEVHRNLHLCKHSGAVYGYIHSAHFRATKEPCYRACAVLLYVALSLCLQVLCWQCYMLLLAAPAGQTCMAP